MPEFYDEETKAIEEKYNDLRELLAKIGAGDKPLRAVKPQLLVAPTETGETSEVTAALIVASVTGGDNLEALTNLETALRIAVYGTYADDVLHDPELVSVDVPLMEVEEESTLVDIVEGFGGDTNTGGRTLN